MLKSLVAIYNMLKAAVMTDSTFVFLRRYYAYWRTGCWLAVAPAGMGHNIDIMRATCMKWPKPLPRIVKKHGLKVVMVAFPAHNNLPVPIGFELTCGDIVGQNPFDLVPTQGLPRPAVSEIKLYGAVFFKWIQVIIALYTALCEAHVRILEIPTDIHLNAAACSCPHIIHSELILIVACFLRTYEVSVKPPASAFLT